jgi:uncharacterized protein
MSRDMKTVVITGASGGIGLALARLFARDGYRIVIVGSDAGRLERAASELEGLGVQVVQIVQDLSQPGSAQRLWDLVRKQRLVVDVLVNNAGFATAGEFSKTDFSRETQEMQLNMITLTELTKLFLPELKVRRGKILNVASMAGFLAMPYMAVYAATKAYVLHYSEALAEELSGSGITVSALCPGATRTGFAAQAGLNSSRMYSGTLPSADQIAAIGYRGMTAGKRVIICGAGNRMSVVFLRLVPRRLVTWAIAKMHRS